MHLPIKKLHPDAIIPQYAHAGDAGMDLYGSETIILNPGERGIIPTGIAMAIPKGHVALVWDKSGPPLKTGMHTLAGVIDETYRGEIKIVVINHGKEPITIERGKKVAQLLIQPVVQPLIQETSELDETPRGSGGFGSTGL
ncbi:MAG: dUTP diphosphatase [archaeon]